MAWPEDSPPVSSAGIILATQQPFEMEPGEQRHAGLFHEAFMEAGGTLPDISGAMMQGLSTIVTSWPSKHEPLRIGPES